jgi:stress-induced morphogen
MNKNINMDRDTIQSIIEQHFPNSTIIIDNMGNSDQNYTVNIKSDMFNRKTKIEQHKMVYSILKKFIGNELHAISIKTESTER